MCGIAGIIVPNAKYFSENLEKMTQAIAHRGPDSEHFEFYPNAGLGHRRLSIIDLSPSGLQPMFSDSKNECIVLNGEIYGFQELKLKYKYPYKGTSDTEVILAMYQQKKEELIKELPGMFGFAIWDEKEQQLFCARDRFGEKPFYYAFGNNGSFVFASEIKAILASGLVNPTINYQAISHYLQYGYVSSQQSIFQNIHTLPPAHSLIYKNGQISVKKYYEIPKKDIQISLSEAKEQFSYLLKNAVKKQLVADVEVGSFLSGGLDSSTIVAMVSEFIPRQTTISFGYSNKNSELKFAKEIAEKYNTNHIEIHEERGSLVDDLLKITQFFDEPFADMSFIPQYKICESASKKLKVVLSGDVGDELFGGYSFYTSEHQMKNHFSYNNIIAKWGLRLLKNFKEISYFSNKNIEFKNIYDFHQNHVRNYFTKEEMNSLGIMEHYHQQYSFQVNKNSLNDIMRTDLERYVPGNMLVKSDRMAMANSLEVRTPFLDLDFAEFCIQLPENLKLNHLNDKIILRESIQHYWTKNIQKRHKQGFGASVNNWLKEVDLKTFSRDILQDKNHPVFTILDFKTVQIMLDENQKEWNLLQLAIWAEKTFKFIN